MPEQHAAVIASPNDTVLDERPEHAGGAEPPELAPERTVPPRAPGLQLLGEYTGSGFSQPQYLVRRHDGQVVQLSRLLYLVVAETDGVAAAGEIAGRVSDAYGRPVSAANVEFLLTDKLQPLGLVLPGTGHGESTSAAPAPRAKPILRLRARRVLIPHRLVRPTAGVLAPLFTPVIVAAVLLGLIAFDVWLFSQHRIAEAGRAVVAHPVLILATIALVVLSALFHEFGHAAGCRYGGGRPGPIGVGLYLVWPTFYTNVTDAYRLNRAGRLRTDLGGFYFNGIYILAMGGIYAASGFPPLPLVVLLIHVEVLQQLLPLVRVDGYFILADLVGVPDLFSRVGPILASLFPRRKAHPMVAHLKRRARVIIIAWLLVTIPLLIGFLALFLIHLPSILTRTGHALQRQMDLTTSAAGGGDVAAAAVGVLSMLLLLLPLVGMAWVLSSLGRRGVFLSFAVWRRFRPQTHLLLGRLFYLGRPRRAGGLPGGQELVTRGGSAAFAKAEVGVESGRWWQKGRQPSRAKKALTARERRQQLLTQLVTAEPDDVSVITVCSQMGGVGKTLISAYLATLAAHHRTNDRVLAVDINPDAGRLRARMGVEEGLSLRQTYEHRSSLTTYAAVRRCFSYTPAGVAVIGSDPNPDRDEGFGDSEYREMIATLSILANTFVNDCGTNLLHPLTRGAMARTDQLVYVTDCSEDGLELTRDAFDTFEVKGYGEQVRSGVLVLTKLTPGSPVERFQETFQSRCRQIVSVRHNEFLARRTPVDVEALDLSDAEALSDLLEVTASVFTGLAGKADTRGSRWRDEDYPVSVTTKELSLQVVPPPVSLP